MSMYLTGIGHFHPAEVLGNSELSATLDTSSEWIESRTGISERRRAGDEVDTSDLGVEATREALAKVGWGATELDLLVCATSTPDRLLPPTATMIGRKLGLVDTPAFDINASCSGVVYSLAVARGFIGIDGYSRIGIAAADKFTKVIDYSDRKSAVLFGDGAATLLLQANAEGAIAEVIDLIVENRNDDPDLVTIPIGGTFSMNGRRVSEIALRGLVDSARKLLSRNGLRPSELKGFVAHQANLRMLEQIRDSLGLTDEQHWHNVERFGNQGTAGAAAVLSAALESNALEKGDLVMLTVYGSGFTGGSVLLRWQGE